MKTTEFYENLEAELAPFTDAEVDAMSSSTESNWRYRLEILFVLVVSAVIPMVITLLGLYAIRAYDLSGLVRLVAGIFLIGCIYGSVRLAKALSKPVVAWRYRASFLRQIAVHKHASGL